MNSQDPDELPESLTEQETGRRRNPKSGTILVVVIFYVILFGLCFAGLAIALLLAARR